MHYAPEFDDATPIAKYALATGRHTAVLLADIKSTGPVEYAFILTVFDDATQQPCLFVASEVNALAATLGGGSHYLGLFPGDGHMNFGASNDWADIHLFAREALRIATRQFQQGN
jgi:hypothetical protein